MVAWTNEISSQSATIAVWSAVRTTWVAVVPVAGGVVLGAPQMACHWYPRVFTPPSSSMIPDVLPILGHALSASPR